MKKASNILRSRSLTVFLLVLWLLLGIMSSLTSPGEYYVQPGIETTDAKEETEDQTLIIKVTEAVQSTVSINLTFQSFLLDELILEDDTDEHEPSSEPFYNAVQKRIKILLRRIISPNAP